MHTHPSTAPTSSRPSGPFLKWAGGKRRLVPQILSILPPSKRLIEPFVGAGAVFAGSEFETYLLADINKDLVNLYDWIAKDCMSLLARCRDLFTEGNREKDAYLSLRNRFNHSQLGMERAALFVYLNRHGFNGLCRYNRAGGFNVPWGRSPSAPMLPEQTMLEWASKLDRATVVCADFAEVMSQAGIGDVIFCDPPYADCNDRPSFVGYAPDGFTWADQRRLVIHALELAGRGVPVAISNHDTPATRDLYRGARIVELSVRRSIGAKGTSRVNVRELLALFEPARPGRLT
jgi:DNA adenine methylase